MISLETKESDYHVKIVQTDDGYKAIYNFKYDNDEGCIIGYGKTFDEAVTSLMENTEDYFLNHEESEDIYELTTEQLMELDKETLINIIGSFKEEAIQLSDAVDDLVDANEELSEVIDELQNTNAELLKKIEKQNEEIKYLKDHNAYLEEHIDDLHINNKKEDKNRESSFEDILRIFLG